MTDDRCQTLHFSATVNRSYVSSADLPFGFTKREFSRVGGYTENPEKPQNKLRPFGEWALARENTNKLSYTEIASAKALGFQCMTNVRLDTQITLVFFGSES